MSNTRFHRELNWVTSAIMAILVVTISSVLGVGHASAADPPGSKTAARMVTTNGKMILGFAYPTAKKLDKIELDDLSLESNAALITDREKWTSDKRNEDPLVFSSHPDFLTFPPDGPLRQLTIQQMRLLKERAQLKPLKGSWRVFLIDSSDRANE